MGFGPNVVGVGRFDEYPEEVGNLPRVGSSLDPNWEAVVSLKPDLLLVMESQEDIRRHAEDLGLRCCLVDQHDLQSVLESFPAIARCCGNAAAGETLRKRIEGRMKEIAAAVEPLPRPRVLVVVGRPPGRPVNVVWVAAPGSLYDDLLRLAGGCNVLKSGPGPYPELGRESMLSLDPDIILDLVPRTSEATVSSADLLRDWEALPPLRARRLGNIHVLDQPWIVVPGPRILDSLELFLRVLHPEL